MGIYWFILIYIILGRVFAKQHKKFYVVSCFMLLILVAGLRNYSVGIDLNKHYARNFISIANTNWSDLNKFTYIGGYDIGFPLYITVDEHMPPEHLYYKEVNSKDGNYYRRWASAIGPMYSKYINTHWGQTPLKM